MSIRLEVQYFRGLRRVDWEFGGVCALTGPNGAGKTTVFTALALLRDAYVKDLGRAVDMHGGAYGFRHFDAPRDEPTWFGLTIDSLRWKLEPVMHGSGIGGPAGELLHAPGQPPFYTRDPGSSLVRVAIDKSLEDVKEIPFLPEFVRRYMRETSRWPEKDGDPNWWLPRFDSVLRNFRFYADYRLAELRRYGSQASSDMALAEDGRNAFSVLRNWRDKKDTRERFEFVLEGLRAAFPDMFEEMDFEVAGSTVTIKIYRPGSNSGVPIELVANGFLVALLHLCAVASMPDDGLMAIDEPENSLHPFAISEILDSMRDYAESHGATILLATHSPAFLNRFNAEPDQVFVMEPDLDISPVALTEHRNPEWLAHFSLGDLFLNQDYAAPRAAKS